MPLKVVKNLAPLDRPGYRLLSKNEASKWIVTDEKETFFDKVANLEMSIQMKAKSRRGI